MTEAEFLRAHAPRVFNLALRLTGNRADAEDLTQDALLRALRALAGFRGDSDPATWAYRITVNAWKNRIRSEKRRAFWKTASLGLIGSDDEDGAIADAKSDEPPLDAELEKEEGAAAVRRALAALAEEDRAIIVLREIEDRTYEDIAEILGVPLGTVKSRLARSRHKLKSILQAAQ